MEFIDLDTQYRKYQEEIDKKMKAVLEHGQYIMGPEIDELEAVLAESKKASREVLSIPMHPFLSEQDQDIVVEKLKESLVI